MLQLIKKIAVVTALNFIVSGAHAQPSCHSVITPGLDLIQQSHLVSSLDPNKTLSFTIWLKLRNKQQLDELAQDVYNPQSVNYHHFLTQATYEQQFAPSAHTETMVQQYFIQHGMSAHVRNHSIRVRGTVAQINHALHIHMNRYRHHNHLFYANAELPHLPPKLSSVILGITGLNSGKKTHSNPIKTKVRKEKTMHQLDFVWNQFAPTALPTDTSLSGFTGAQLQKTYNLSNIPPVNGVHLDGKGQTLVIVDKCGTNGPVDILNDANTYFNENGITPFTTTGVKKNFAIINSDGTPFKKCPDASSFSREIVLDIESSHTIAPGDNTVLVLGKDQQTTLIDVIHTLINNNYTIAGFSNAYVISNSWSDPETSYNTVLEQTLELASAHGISVNFSSGDCGDNTYATSGKCTGSSNTPVVNYPSSSAYVTAVGATAVFVDASYRYAFETVWGTVRPSGNSYAYDGGTGGGISKCYGPVAWQDSIDTFTAGGYGVISDFHRRRSLPDVAMLGDPQTGLLIIAEGQQVKDGGTSLACPLFSATLILVNQARNLLNKGTPIGHAAPYLYQSNSLLLTSNALRLIIPPAIMISGATPPPATTIQGVPAPASAFTIHNATFGWDSSLTIEPEKQFWNDAVGVGSPNIPNFVTIMANM